MADVTKKSKKDKKAAAAAAAEPAPVEAAAAVENGADDSSKKRKKDKKRAEAEAKAADATASNGAEATTNGDESAKKKRRKEQAAAAPAEAEVVAEETEEQRKARKAAKKAAKAAAAAAAAGEGGEEEPEAKEEKKLAKAAPLTYTATASKTFRRDFYREDPAVARMTPAEVAALRAELEVVIHAPSGVEAGISAGRQRSAAEAAEEQKRGPATFVDIKPLRTFAQSGLPADMLKCTSTFTRPTPIQSQVWPAILSGRDVIAIAETGSGKTLGFMLPALIHIQDQAPLGPGAKAGPIVLVLSPTRELAMQTEVVARDSGLPLGIRATCIYGGVDKHVQKKALKQGAHVVVATPGRLLGLLQEGALTLNRVTYLVLDEADRMLDLGFEPDIRAIVSLIGPERQTLLFSATWPTAIQALGREFVQNPFHVTIGKNQGELAANHRVKQIIEVIEDRARDKRLLQLLTEYHSSRKNRVLIFVLYKKEVDRVEQWLTRNGWKAVGISGDKNQADRTSALASFKDGSTPLLIATDVAARGLDIPSVEYVINYSFPLTIEDYVHRIGRTGRGGKTGISHTFFVGANEKGLAGELASVLKEAGEPVPEALLAFGLTTKKKEHALYGNHFRKDSDMKAMPAQRKVKF